MRTLRCSFRTNISLIQNVDITIQTLKEASASLKNELRLFNESDDAQYDFSDPKFHNLHRFASIKLFQKCAHSRSDIQCLGVSGDRFFETERAGKR